MTTTTGNNLFLACMIAAGLHSPIGSAQPAWPPAQSSTAQPTTQGIVQPTSPGLPQAPAFNFPQPQQQGFPQPGMPLPGFPGAGAPPGQLPHTGNLPNAPRSNPYANLPAVTIREFRSSVPEIAARGATDMFMTALLKTRKFRVLERARLSEGIAQEKALNQQGMTTGDVGQSRYVGAGYMFEATISGASTDAERTSFNISIAGLGGGKANTRDMIAIDVRVIDIESGVVLDAIDVRKEILGEETTVGGTAGQLVNVFTGGKGGALVDALAPAGEIKTTRKDSVDNALRAAIQEAVNDIAGRFGSDATQQPALQSPATLLPLPAPR